MLFNKCLKEPNYIDLYMEIVDQLFAKFRENKELNFRKLFLTYCQTKLQAQENDILLMATAGEDDETVMKKKERILGSVKLIAELFVRGAVPDDYVKLCLDKLLSKSIEDNIESAVFLIQGIGKKLYEYFAFESKLTTLTKKPKLKVRKFTKELFDDYIDKLIALKQTDKLTSRVKFAIQDLVDARDKDWANAFNQFPVPKQPGKPKEDIVAYRKKSKSIEKPEVPQEKPKEPAAVEAKPAVPERRVQAEQSVWGRSLEKYNKSKLEEKNRVRAHTIYNADSCVCTTSWMSICCTSRFPM